MHALFNESLDRRRMHDVNNVVLRNIIKEIKLRNVAGFQNSIF